MATLPISTKRLKTIADKRRTKDLSGVVGRKERSRVVWRELKKLVKEDRKAALARHMEKKQKKALSS